jgi:hypothetical protein
VGVDTYMQAHRQIARCCMAKGACSRVELAVVVNVGRSGEFGCLEECTALARQSNPRQVTALVSERASTRS